MLFRLFATRPGRPLSESLGYTSNRCTPIDVLPVPNAYTTSEQTTSDIFNVLLQSVVYALGQEVPQLVYTLLTCKLVEYISLRNQSHCEYHVYKGNFVSSGSTNSATMVLN